MSVSLDVSALDSRQNIKILTLFLIVQFFGLLLITQVYNGQPQILVQVYHVATSPTIPLYYVLALIVFVAFIILVMRNIGTKLLFTILEAFVILVGSFLTFLMVLGALTAQLQQDLIAIFFGYLYSNVPGYEIIAAVLLSILVLLAKRRFPRLRNAVTVLCSVGIGTLIGLEVGFLVAMLLLLIFAIYDIIAVFGTKHMVAMGNAAVSMNLALMVGVTDAEGIPAGTLTKEEKQRANRYKELFKNHKPILKELNKRKMEPYFGLRALGNGDLAIPLMVEIAAYQISSSFVGCIVAAIGASFGLLLTFYILAKYRRPLPAIPPLAFGIVIALAIYVAALSI